MKKFALILMMVAVLALPATAVAADGYTNVPGVTQESAPQAGSESGNPAAVASAGAPTDSGILPFTGLELALMFGAGVVLLGTGVALRKAHTR